MYKRVRTRFAPSPTGYMHIGNLRTALFAYLIAKKQDGDFILRIEDTDQERYVEGAVDVIYDTLRVAGLNWDEGPDIGGPVGPYVQSERMGMFKSYAEKLVKTGHAYYCFCDKERLEEVRKIQEASHIAPMYDRHCRNLSPEEIQEKLDAGVPYVIRQKMPLEGTTTFHDDIYGDVTVENSTLDDQKLRAINGAYVHKMDPADFEKAAEPYIRQTVKRTDIDLSLLCSVLQNRTEVFSDIPEQVDFIDAMPEYDLEMYRHKKMKTTPETALEALKEALPVLESVEQWDTEHIHEALFAKIADLGVKNGWMLWPLRTAVSGKQFTPGGGVELCAILGKEDTLARVRKAIDALSA